MVIESGHFEITSPREMLEIKLDLQMDVMQAMGYGTDNEDFELWIQNHAAEYFAEIFETNGSVKQALARGDRKKAMTIMMQELVQRDIPMYGDDEK